MRRWPTFVESGRFARRAIVSKVMSPRYLRRRRTGSSWNDRDRMRPIAWEIGASSETVTTSGDISCDAVGHAEGMGRASEGGVLAFSPGSAGRTDGRGRRKRPKFADHLVAVLPVGVVPAQEVGDRVAEPGVEADGGRVGDPDLERRPVKAPLDAPVEEGPHEEFPDALATESPVHGEHAHPPLPFALVDSEQEPYRSAVGAGGDQKARRPGGPERLVEARVVVFPQRLGHDPGDAGDVRRHETPQGDRGPVGVGRPFGRGRRLSDTYHPAPPTERCASWRACAAAPRDSAAPRPRSRPPSCGAGPYRRRGAAPAG